MTARGDQIDSDSLTVSPEREGPAAGAGAYPACRRPAVEAPDRLQSKDRTSPEEEAHAKLHLQSTRIVTRTIEDRKVCARSLTSYILI